MSTDVAIRPAAGTVSVIQETAHELMAAKQIADAICSTSFVPVHFRNKPEECAVAILYGATIDFDPVTAVQQIYVIGGKPALYARAMVAVVLSKGHEIWVEDEGQGKVTVAGRRKGTDKVQRITWTTEDARRAGYTSNKKYETDPRAMLYARASGDIARRIAPDALMGMAYTVEELELVEAPAEPTAQTSKVGTAGLRAVVGVEATPDVTPDPEPTPEDIQDVEIVDAPRDWVSEASELTDVDAIKALYAEAGTAGASRDVLGAIARRGVEVERAGDQP